MQTQVGDSVTVGGAPGGDIAIQETFIRNGRSASTS